MKVRKKIVWKTMSRLREREVKGIPFHPSMRRGTKEYIKSSYWTTLNQRCVNGSHFKDTPKNSSYKRSNRKLELTKEEFDIWVDENWDKFLALYECGKTPSIDRIDNSIGYRVSNMNVIDLKENMAKDRVKPIVGTSILTGDVIKYPSATFAERDGFNRKNISQSIRTGGTHHGFMWAFA